MPFDRDRLIAWAPAAATAAATLIVFLPALQCGFVNWDDDANFLANQLYRGLGWQNLRWMATTLHLGPYQPLCWLSFGLDFTLWGMKPWGYHLTNLLLHAANAGLFCLLAQRLLAASAEPGTDRKHLPLAAAAAALLFSIHPLRVESVAWITERKDVLSGFFYLLTVLCYVEAAASRDARARSLRRLAVASYLLSLLAKGIGVSLPIVLTVLDVYPLRRLPADIRQWPSRWDVWREKVPYWVLAAAAVAVGYAGQTRAGALGSAGHGDLALPLAHAMFGVVFYLWKTILPHPLIPLYQMPGVLNVLDWPFLVGGSVVLGLSLLLFVARRKAAAPLAAWACYLATLLPVLGIVQMGPQMVADRYTYLACLGWPLMVSGVWLRCRTRARFLAAGAVMAAVLPVLSWMTRRQIGIWRDSQSLWSHVLRVDPTSSIAHANLAMALQEQGRLDEALDHCQQALALDPRHFKSRRNLGEILSQKGRYEEALTELQTALGLHPDDADTYNDLGIVLRRLGRLPEAIDHYRKALDLNPSMPAAHYNLGNALVDRGELEEAVARYRRTLELNPEHLKARSRLERLAAGSSTPR